MTDPDPEGSDNIAYLKALVHARGSSEEAAAFFATLNNRLQVCRNLLF